MKFKSLASKAFSIILLHAIVNSAFSQTPPDAGSLLQSLERDRQQKERDSGRTIIPPANRGGAPPAPHDGKSQITVKKFIFSGNTLVKTEDLEKSVISWLNRPLSFGELQSAAAAAAEAYRVNGWVARSLLPAQKIVDGVVLIQIIEAKFGGVKVIIPQPSRHDPTVFKRIIEEQQPPGAPLNNDAVDRGLLLATDRPGVELQGGLAEGANPQETDLVLQLVDKSAFSGDVGIDNTGSRSTGSHRIAATGYFSSPLGLGELASINHVRTFASDQPAESGSDYTRAALSFPISYTGWRVGVSASNMFYRVISPDLVALRSRGSSRTLGVDTSYPLYRSRATNIYFTTNYDFKLFYNKALGDVVSDYKSHSVTAGVNVSFVDKFEGENSINLTLTGGFIDLDGSPNQAADFTTNRIGKHFAKPKISYSRKQPFGDDLSIILNVTAQGASRNMDSSEKLYLGGSSGVRAYPSSEAGGALGYMLNLEIQKKLSEAFALTAFIDHGRVIVNRNNDGLGATHPNGMSLHGAGLSAVWRSQSGYFVKGVWSHRLGVNPNPTSTGADQDGTKVLHRIWVQASRSF